MAMPWLLMDLRRGQKALIVPVHEPGPPGRFTCDVGGMRVLLIGAIITRLWFSIVDMLSGECMPVDPVTRRSL